MTKLSIILLSLLIITKCDDLMDEEDNFDDLEDHEDEIGSMTDIDPTEFVDALE